MKLDNQLPAVASALPDSGTVSSLGSSDSVMNSQSSSDLSDHSLDDFSEELYYFDDDSLETEVDPFQCHLISIVYFKIVGLRRFSTVLFFVSFFFQAFFLQIAIALFIIGLPSIPSVSVYDVEC